MADTPAHFSCTKLIVADLESAHAFYTSVFGLQEMARVDAAIEGRPIREIMFHPTAPGGSTFVLLTYPDTQKPSLSEAITLFIMPDLAALPEKVRAAGGRITDEARDMPEHGVRVAFARDNEGHLIEIVQML
ncbi:MAG TPA: VOC family protein [Alphaproteobacteria bacterium]|nr:VOC family protein [Alphaproteobacteria bacterium]